MSHHPTTMEESDGAQQQQRFLRRDSEELTLKEEVVRGGDEPQQHAQRRVNDGVVREESSEVTAVEGHSDMLFDAATYASESHLMDRYRNRIGPIFEDVLRNVHARFLAGYKVYKREGERGTTRKLCLPIPKNFN